MHIAIRADGGAQIGYGHLVRSSALAEEILSRGHIVTVATTTPQPAQEVFPDTVETTTLSKRDEYEPFVEWIETGNPDVVFTDAYPIDTGYQRAVRDRVPLAVLQDDARHPVCCDILINGNLYASDLDYEWTNSEPEWWLGPEYLLLRGEIRDYAKKESPWREVPERALITMGGSDMQNLTPTIVQAFDGLALRVDAIVGPGFSEQQEVDIRDAAGDVSGDVRVARDPDDFPKRMFQADFAVSTASSTTYELLALGTPIISIPVADNQEPIAAALREHDAATVLERDAGVTAFLAAIEEYMTDPEIRQKRRNLGRGLVDDRGAERVCDEILSVVDEKPET